MIKNKKYQKCLAYIEKYWKKSTFELLHDTQTQLKLPNKFVSPTAGKHFAGDQFYWDSYFIIIGLLAFNGSEKSELKKERIKLAKGMVDNFAYLFKKLGFIPVRNAFFNLVISQPPFLTSMALEVFALDKNKKWLAKIALIAEKELNNYWQDSVWLNREEKELRHLTPTGLIRYCDYYRDNDISEYESGWDLTSRFNEQCLDFLPIDLNCLLYKYEKDLSAIYKILGKKQKNLEYLKKSSKRKKLINKFMWNEREGFFFDYNFNKKNKSKFLSLAGYYPLWSGLASKNQAARLIKKLNKFENTHGLANTGKIGLAKNFKQWDYPNGWPNQQWIVIKGLLNYGYRIEALRLAEKWLNLNTKMFIKTGKMWEKYDVVKGAIGKAEKRYPTQSGFGWTNGVYARLIKELDL